MPYEKGKKFTDEELFAALREDRIELTNEEIQKVKDNDVVTIHEIGRVYYTNNISNPRAFAWYYKAALENHSDAQYRIGWMYQHGEGVTKDFKQSWDWLMKSANNNNADAQNDIGFWYHYGIYVDKNVQSAIEWYTLAANQGHARAQHNLGVVYAREDEVRDLHKAVHWYQKAEHKVERAKGKMKELNEQGYHANGDNSKGIGFISYLFLL